MGETKLLNFEGNMCCLGHISLQCGVPGIELQNVGSPKNVASLVLLDFLSTYRLTEWGYRSGVETTSLTNSAIEINDDKYLSDTEREKKLTTLFAGHGYTLKFEGEYLGGHLDAVQRFMSASKDAGTD